MIGAAGGAIVDLEASPDYVSRLDPEDGIITHSNHFLAAGHGESLLEKISPNTLYRAERMRRLLAADRGALAFDHMRAAAATISARLMRSAVIPIRASPRRGAP